MIRIIKYYLLLIIFLFPNYLRAQENNWINQLFSLDFETSRLSTHKIDDVCKKKIALDIIYLLQTYGQNSAADSKLCECSNQDIGLHALKQICQGYLENNYNRNQGEAYNFFYNAHIGSLKSRDTLVHKLSLFALLDLYRLDVYRSDNKARKYLDEYTKLANTKIDSAWIQYNKAVFTARNKLPDKQNAKEQNSRLKKWSKKLINNPRLKSLIDASIALNHEIAENWDGAKLIYNQIITDYDRTGFLEFIVRRSCLRMSDIAIAQNEMQNAINFLEKTKEYIDDVDTTRTNMYINFRYAKIYKKLNEHDKAYVSLESVLNSVLSLSLVDNTIKNSIVETELQTAEKEKQLIIRNAELEKEKAENLQQRLWLLFLAGLSILLTFLGIGSYRFQILKRKTALEKAETEALLRATKAKMEGEQEERKVIASLLHDRVASLLTAADMQLSVAKMNVSDEDSPLGKTSTILQEVNTQVRDLSHQLVSPTLIRFGLAPALDSLCQKMTSQSVRVGFESKMDKERYDSQLEGYLYSACSELINNALKHSEASQIQVRLTSVDRMLCMSVADNGLGMNIPQANEGLGLLTIRKRAESLQGSFQISSNEEGTTVSISIPVAEV